MGVLVDGRAPVEEEVLPGDAAHGRDDVVEGGDVLGGSGVLHAPRVVGGGPFPSDPEDGVGLPTVDEVLRQLLVDARGWRGSVPGSSCSATWPRRGRAATTSRAVGNCRWRSTTTGSCSPRSPAPIRRGDWRAPLTSPGLCEDTKRPKALDEPWGSKHPVIVDRVSTSSAAPIPPLRIRHSPEGPSPPSDGPRAA